MISLKISKKNSKGLSGKYKLLGQLIATGVALFFLLGPFANDLNGAGDEALGSSQKMREFWIPFVSYEILQAFPYYHWHFVRALSTNSYGYK